MTSQQFLDWLKHTYKCESTPVEGRNTTGFSIKIYCPKTQRSHYFSGPFGSAELSHKAIKRVCNDLDLPYPLGVS